MKFNMNNVKVFISHRSSKSVMRGTGCRHLSYFHAAAGVLWKWAAASGATGLVKELLFCKVPSIHRNEFIAFRDNW